MKPVFLLLFLLGVQKMYSQKYVLLDRNLSLPVIYSNSITMDDITKGYFPVEKKNIKQFLKTLEEIEKKLTLPGHLFEATQYEIGCIKFKGLTVSKLDGERLDYVLTFTCGNIPITLHLSDSKSRNAANAFYIRTFIKYIHSFIP